MCTFITESHNGWGWKEALEIMWSKPLLKQGQNLVILVCFILKKTARNALWGARRRGKLIFLKPNPTFLTFCLPTSQFSDKTTIALQWKRVGAKLFCCFNVVISSSVCARGQLNVFYPRWSVCCKRTALEQGLLCTESSFAFINRVISLILRQCFSFPIHMFLLTQ